MLLPGMEWKIVLLLCVSGFIVESQAEFFSRKWLPFADTAEGSVKTWKPRFAREILRAGRALGVQTEGSDRDRRSLDGVDLSATADGNGSGDVQATSFAKTPSGNGELDLSGNEDITGSSANGNLDATARAGSSETHVSANGNTGSGNSNEGLLGGILSTGSGSHEGLLGGILNSGSNENGGTTAHGDGTASGGGSTSPGYTDALDCGGDCGLSFNVGGKRPGGSTLASGEVGVNTHKHGKGIIGQLQKGLQRGINNIKGILTGKKNKRQNSNESDYDDYDTTGGTPSHNSADLGLNVNGRQADLTLNTDSSGELSMLVRSTRNLIRRLLRALLSLPYSVLNLLLYLVKLVVRVLLFPLRLLANIIHGRLHLRHA